MKSIHRSKLAFQTPNSIYLLLLALVESKLKVQEKAEYGREMIEKQSNKPRHGHICGDTEPEQQS